jgi:ABC-type xylose transport system substrate-binding protein
MDNQEWTIMNGQSRMDNQEWAIKNGQSRMDNQVTLNVPII